MKVGSAGQQTATQFTALRKRLATDIYRYSAFHRGRLDRAGLGKRGIKRRSDLVRLAPMTLQDVRSPGTLLLAPMSLAGHGKLRKYWPLQWMHAGAVPVGYSGQDLDLLADLGRRLLEAAGVSAADVIANLLPLESTRDYWQLQLGARVAGMSSASLGPGQTIARIDVLSPTVLIGSAKELARLLDAAGAAEGTLRKVHTAIVVGEAATDRQFQRMVKALGGKESAIVRAWAPEGVLALWGECRGGVGLHTWPDTELIEIVDPVSGLGLNADAPGTVVWTGTAWLATAIVRLATETPALQLDQRCPACGRHSPRIYPMEEALGFPMVLDLNPLVTGWVAELQRSPNGGIDQLVIWLATEDPIASLTVLQELDAKIGPSKVFLVDQDEVDRRLYEAKGERFGDRRAFS